MTGSQSTMSKGHASTVTLPATLSETEKLPRYERKKGPDARSHLPWGVGFGSSGS